MNISGKQKSRKKEKRNEAENERPAKALRRKEAYLPKTTEPDMNLSQEAIEATKVSNVMRLEILQYAGGKGIQFFCQHIHEFCHLNSLEKNNL